MYRLYAVAAALVAATMLIPAAAHAQAPDRPLPADAPECLAPDPPRFCREDPHRQSQGLAACTIGAETGADPVTIKGSGQRASAPFKLDGGAYRVEWSMSGKAEGYRLIALKPTDTADIFRSSDIMNALGDTAGTSADTFVYGVKAGTYYLDVRAPSGWKVTLTPITT